MRHYQLLAPLMALCGGMGGTLTAPVWAANTPTKLTMLVPMRDGIHLATDVRLPAGDGPWPVVLCRTPYDKSTDVGSVSLSDVCRFAQNGLALVVQYTRGRHASEGKARPMFDDCSW